MKKIFLGITIGLLISTVGVYAVNYLASDVTYKNTTVESALNDLYSKISSTISFDNAIQSSSEGSRISKRTTSITLDKGKYIVSAVSNLSSFPSESNSSNNTNKILNIICDNTVCNYKNLSNLQTISTGTTKIDTTSYVSSNIVNSLYYVEITKDNTIVTSSLEVSASDKTTSSVILQAIPIK